LPDDSVSEITDLEVEDILHKYYKQKLTKIEMQKKEKKQDMAEARKRLLGD
jgi:hypothetical protein